jgi:diacylglycerol kinase family enzyme
MAGTKLLTDATDVVFVVNPLAGARSRQSIVQQAAQHLTGWGFRSEIVDDPVRAGDLASAKLEQGTLRAVVAAGGDGTVAAVANRTAAGTPIAILPMGTENLLAKHLGIPKDAEGVCKMIRRRHLTRLDAGRANGRLFLLMVGCGFDAEVVRRLALARSGHITHLSYLKPILDSIRSYQYPELRIYLQSFDTSVGAACSTTARWAFVANLPRYARGLGIAPRACGTDGVLDVCTFRRGSLFRGLVYLMGVLAGSHESLNDCVMSQATRMRIDSDAEVPYQLDGDPGGYLPVDIEVAPGRLTLVVPGP